MAKNPDSRADSSDLSGLCPRCGRVAAFSRVAGTPLKPDGSEQVSILQCMGCSDSIVVVEQKVDEQDQYHAFFYKRIHWWPTPGWSDLDSDIPTNVATAYSEGMRALSVNAARAAAVMFRGMLAQVVADKGSAAARAKHTLYDKLDQMSRDGSLHPSLVEWAREIRLIGNAAAHPDALDPVSDDEAADLSRLCRELLNVIYQVPARLARSRAARGSV